jgi:hypothetical protein
MQAGSPRAIGRGSSPQHTFGYSSADDTVLGQAHWGCVGWRPRAPVVGDSNFGPRHYRSGCCDKGCSGGRPLFSAPPVCAYDCLGCRACRGCQWGGHVPGPRRLFHRCAPAGRRMRLCRGPWQAFLHCVGVGGRMCHCCVVPTTHAGWHCVVETLSSPPTAPPCIEQRVDLVLSLVSLGHHGL